MLAPPQHPSFSTVICHQSATTCSIHSQLPSTSVDRLHYAQLQDVPYRGERRSKLNKSLLHYMPLERQIGE